MSVFRLVREHRCREPTKTTLVQQELKGELEFEEKGEGEICAFLLVCEEVGARKLVALGDGGLAGTADFIEPGVEGCDVAILGAGRVYISLVLCGIDDT